MCMYCTVLPVSIPYVCDALLTYLLYSMGHRLVLFLKLLWYGRFQHLAFLLLACFTEDCHHGEKRDTAKRRGTDVVPGEGNHSIDMCISFLSEFTCLCFSVCVVSIGWHACLCGQNVMVQLKFVPCCMHALLKSLLLCVIHVWILVDLSQVTRQRFDLSNISATHCCLLHWWWLTECVMVNYGNIKFIHY